MGEQLGPLGPHSGRKRDPHHRFQTLALALCIAGSLVACDSGDGGDNGGVGNPDTGNNVGAVDPGSPAGLVFSYPVNGQTDVYPGTTIAFAFNAEADGNVALIDTRTNRRLETTVVNQGNGIYNIIPADSDAQMAPGTTYAVVADGDIGDDDNTAFASGDTLFAFTTEASPGAATDSDFTLVNFPSGNDAGFPIMGESFPFTEFNTLRARFSQPVDESSVQLCTGNESLGDDGCSVAVTGPGGDNVAGRLSVLGKNFVFDPGTINPDPSNQDPDQYADDDLEAGVRYTVNFGGDFRSASGQNLTGTESFSVTPLGIDTGDRTDVVQRLRIGPVGSRNGNDSMTSPLSGRAPNNIELASQLIGSYNLAAVPSPEQGGLQVRLAAFNGERFGGKIPTVLPRGQKFLLTDFNLALGSQLNDDGTFTEGQVDTPVNLDNLEIQFANDSDVYLLGNALSNVETPTRVTQRLDLNIFGQVSPNSPIEALSNGVVNQTALNVLASGIAIPQDNGDISLVLYGSFPISVNRDGEAATNFELELTLPAGADDQPEIMSDQSAPFITATTPTRCSGVFGLRSFVDRSDELPLFSSIESNCTSALANGRYAFPGATEAYTTEGTLPDNATVFDIFPVFVPLTPSTPYIDYQPLSANPAVLFSESIDPSSLGQVTLTTDDGTLVPITSHVEGASLVIAPVNGLQPNTQYQVDVGGVTDLAGNGLTGAMDSAFTFQTESLVEGDISLVKQSAPYLESINIGLGCALTGGDFRDGGNVAGRCVGDGLVARADDMTGEASIVSQPGSAYAVFSSPANVAPAIRFSKEVQRESVRLADGCLVGGDSNDRDGATIALQRMNGGNCVEAVSASLTFDGNRGSEEAQALVREVRINPTRPLDENARYWIVLCGSDNQTGDTASSDDDDSQCSSGATIIDRGGLALNTDPLRGTGTQIDGQTGQLQADRGDGGPDLIVPFVATAATPDYFSAVDTFPNADTNGNGLFEGGTLPLFVPGGAPEESLGTAGIFPPGRLTADDAPFDATYQDLVEPMLGSEDYQYGNSLLSQTLLDPGTPFEGGAQLNLAFFSGSLQIALRQAETGSACAGALDVLDTDQSVVSNISNNTCIPTSILPGSTSAITSFDAAGTGANTGRIFLRYKAPVSDSSLMGDEAALRTGSQMGYVVPSCRGADENGDAFEYSPCFVASLDVTVNLPGLLDAPGTLLIDQQVVPVQVYGPLNFEQNGRLTLTLKNANTFGISGELSLFGGPGFPGPALLQQVTPGQLRLQVMGMARHGGTSYPPR